MGILGTFWPASQAKTVSFRVNETLYQKERWKVTKTPPLAFAHTHTHTHTNTYVCVCVCVHAYRWKEALKFEQDGIGKC